MRSVRSLLVAALALVLVATACGAEFETVSTGGSGATGTTGDSDGDGGGANTTTTTESDDPVELADGSFTVDAPLQVMVGDSFEVSLAVQAGGDVSIEAASPACESSSATGFRALKVGRCLLLARQDSTSTHSAAAPQEAGIEIVDRPVASFVLTAPADVPVDEAFDVELSQAVGLQGSVAVTASGQCRLQIDGSSAVASVAVDDSVALVSTGLGPCRITAVGKAAPGYADPVPVKKQVAIIKRQGAFDLTTPTEVVIGDTFTVEATNVVGGTVAVALRDGPCQTTGKLLSSTLVSKQSVVNASAGSFEATGSGTCVFVGSQAETDFYTPADDKGVKVSVAKRLAELTLAHPSTIVIDETFSISLNFGLANPPDELVQALSGDVSGPCIPAPVIGLAYSGSLLSRYQGTDIGTCVITVVQAETENFRAQKLSGDVVVTKKLGSVSIQTTTKPGNTTYQSGEEIVVVFEGDPPMVTTNSDVCTLTGAYATGRTAAYDITFIPDGGTCVISATQAESATHTGSSDSASIQFSTIY